MISQSFHIVILTRHTPAMTTLLMWIWAIAVAIMGVRAAAGVEVRVSGGVVKGAILRSRDGRDYHAFKAIPYAQPPVGDKRFMVSREKNK